MFHTRLEEEQQDTIKLFLLENDQPLSYRQTLELWAGNAEFRQFWIDQMKAIPFDGYLWETPPINHNLVNQPFECVFIERTSFSRLRPNATAYSGYFNSEPVVDFLSNSNMTLIAPCPLADDQCYTHLGSFTTTAPEEQQLALWQRVGALGLAQLSDNKLWISTHGFGVSWLHVRLDTFPKYYHYSAYRKG